MPRVPRSAILELHAEVNSDLSQVVQQRTVRCGCGPCLSLGRLRLRWRSDRQKVCLTDLEGVSHDLQAMVQEAPKVGMVMVFRSREQLHQLCVAFERLEVEGVELSS